MSLSDAPKAHWSELFGNKYIKTPDPAMLSNEGLIKSQRCRTLDDSERIVRLIKYDREYVTKYLEMKLIKPLFIIGENEVIDLVKESWDYYCKPSSKTEVEEDS